ncbi:hypothetical protein GWI33_006701 [Rhynchophorus ferrugineus]|uniref:Elongation of very long chain fatty acids protein n=1 Tax=Rhynchophorus ferrugineus TaxID=354439 RepID=A0A834IKQ5_RHYFE|nr:hypothetical protein GWI33_006701 [Rhynchophorus ferrugineus]
MASIVHKAIENYNDLINGGKDALVNQWPLMQSPIPMISIVVLYLYFVLSWGPRWMEKKPAFELKNAMIFYNLYQICTNASLDPKLEYILVKTTWWYFFSKITELMDTVFFVLRKKQSQVSFLHVYHHSIVLIGSWAYLKYMPGEQGVAIGFLNSLVHVVMYFYYFLAALGPQYQKYLWWKKYMTWMQLIQFGIMLVYLAVGVAVNCEMPRGWTYFFTTNVAIFMYLFWDYYQKAYKGSLKRKLMSFQHGSTSDGKTKTDVRLNGATKETSVRSEVPTHLSDKQKG